MVTTSVRDIDFLLEYLQKHMVIVRVWDSIMTFLDICNSYGLYHV